MTKLFDLDEKACVPGYATIKERIDSLHKNKDLLDETTFYLYEKKSCKEYRNYINLCVYIDGDLKAYAPRDASLLPKFNFAENAKSSCYPNNDGLSMLIKDVLAEGPNARDNDYQKAILASRSRMPASKGSTSKDCDQVRKSYIYFACNRYEGLKDEDPAFISAEDAHKERIKSIRNSNGTGSGGQAN